jgi:hypothetical protein
MQATSLIRHQNDILARNNSSVHERGIRFQPIRTGAAQFAGGGQRKQLGLSKPMRPVGSYLLKGTPNVSRAV